MFDADTRPEDEVTRCIWQQHSFPSHEDKVACHSDEYDSMWRAGGLRASEVASLFQMASSYSPNPTRSLSPSALSVCLQSAI